METLVLVIGSFALFLGYCFLEVIVEFIMDNIKSESISLSRMNRIV